MNSDQKIEAIRNFCTTIMQQWTKVVCDKNSYEEGKVVGRSALAEIILEIINNG